MPGAAPKSSRAADRAPFARLFAGILLLAGLLCGTAIYLIAGAAAESRREHARAAYAEAVAVADDVRESVRAAGAEPALRRNALMAYLGSVPEGCAHPVTAVFSWDAERGLVWNLGLTEGPCAILSRRRHFNEWKGNTRRTRQRDVARLADGDASAWLLWGRVGDTLYGLVFEEYPVAVSHAHLLWWLLGAAVVAVALALVALARVILQRARQSRRDDALKSRFVSDVSHELKTPLAAMGLWVDLLLQNRLTDPSRRIHALEVIRDEKDRLLRLTENLLGFARLEQGRRRYAFAELDVARLAHDTVSLVQGDFLEHGITLSATGACLVRADRDAVREIILNLLGNAAKYAASDAVTVKVLADERHVRLTVADRGPGIPAADAAHVFDRFHRADDDHVRAKGGFGLGLPIARRLARDMGGDLTYVPREGGGACFTLSLPVGEKVTGKRKNVVQ